MRSIFAGLLVCAALHAPQLRAGEAAGAMKGTIAMSGAWALYPMAVKWAEEFRKIHPDVGIDIAAGGAGKGMADALAGVVEIGMVSRAINPAEAAKGAWWVPVTKDAVVPTVSERNPVLKELLMRGVRRETFAGMWLSGAVKEWGVVAGTGAKEPIHVFTRSDACGAAQTWAEYLGGKQEDLSGIGVYGDPGLADAVKRNALAVGYNNVNYAYDAKTRKPIKGVRVLPIDIDGNGRLDEGENFYGTRDELTRAIADGRYPSPPARELYFVCRGRPRKEAVREFIRWVLTEGQKYVPEAGYIRLSDRKIQESLSSLGGK